MNGSKCVLLIGCCILSALNIGIVNTIGTMFLALLDKFRESRAVTATVQSILLGTATCFSVVSGLLVNKFGVTRVFVAGTTMLSGGFIVAFFARSILVLNIVACFIPGIGISMVYICLNVAVRNNFDGRTREIALSCLHISMGVGAVIYPQLLKTLLNDFGVNGTFLILGGIYLNNLTFAPLIFNAEQTLNVEKRTCESVKEKPEPADICDGDDKDVTCAACTDYSPVRRLVKDNLNQICQLMEFRYIIVLVGGCLVISVANSHLIVYEDVYAWKNVSNSQTLSLFTTYKSAAVVGRGLPIIFTLIKPGDDMLLLFVLCALSACTGQLLLVFFSSLEAAFTANVFSGVTQGLIMSVVTVSLANTTKEGLFGVALGLFLTIDGLLTISGGPLFGYIRDSVKSYELALLLSVALNGLAALLFTSAVIRKVAVSRKQSFKIKCVEPGVR